MPETIGDRIFSEAVNKLDVSTALILVDDAGLITRFNIAAGYLWHLPTEGIGAAIQSSVIGKHFTILMPDGFIEIHDLYFARAKSAAVEIGAKLHLDFKVMSAGRSIALKTFDGRPQLAQLSFQSFRSPGQTKTETLIAAIDAKSDKSQNLVSSFGSYLEKALNDPKIIRIIDNAKKINLALSIGKFTLTAIAIIGAGWAGINRFILQALHLEQKEDAAVVLGDTSNGAEIGRTLATLASVTNASRAQFFLYSREGEAFYESFLSEYQWAEPGLNLIPEGDYIIEKTIKGTGVPTAQQRRFETLSNEKCIIFRREELDKRDFLREAFQSSITEVQMACPIKIGRGLGVIAVEFPRRDFDEIETKTYLYQYGSLIAVLLDPDR